VNDWFTFVDANKILSITGGGGGGVGVGIGVAVGVGVGTFRRSVAVVVPPALEAVNCTGVGSACPVGMPIIADNADSNVSPAGRPVTPSMVAPLASN